MSLCYAYFDQKKSYEKWSPSVNLHLQSEAQTQHFKSILCTYAS